MGIVSLEGLEFFAYHGFYEEEQRIGNRYSIDVSIQTDVSEAAEKDRLKATVNYEVVYKIVADVMKEPAKLLEHVAHRIIVQIKEHFPAVDWVEVSVSKYNPPIGGVCTRAKVTMRM
jgi:7,8-dihydroneopterin aldolase/epimerase/oxygenase